MEGNDLVSIATVTSPTEAEIIRGALQAAGIACEIGGEGQAGFSGIWSIDILTREADARNARKHLKLLKKGVRERRKRRAAAKKATTESPSDAIQEGMPKTNIKKRKE